MLTYCERISFLKSLVNLIRWSTWCHVKSWKNYIFTFKRFITTKLDRVLSSRSRFGTQMLKLSHYNLKSRMNYYWVVFVKKTLYPAKHLWWTFLENSQQLKTIIHFHKKVPSEMIDTVWNTFLVSIPFGFYLHFYYSDKVLHWLRCFFKIYLKFPPMNSHFNQIYWLCFRKGLSQVQLICLCNHQLKYRFHYFSALFVISSYIVVAG